MQAKSIAINATLIPVVLAASVATSFTGTAFAQSNVTLSGAVDLALAHGSGSISNQTRMDPNDLGATKLSFKGFEDLGGGLKAGFWLEAGANPDTGTGQNTNTNNQPSGAAGNGGLTFNRRSHVSLGGDWGEIRLGRDFTPQYMGLAVFDPFDVGGSGAIEVLNSSIVGPTAVRASNSISYLYGHGFNAAAIGYGPRGFSGSGLQFHAMYYMGENPGGSATSKDGNGYGARAVYSTGKFTVSGAVGGTSYAAGDVRRNNAGASYDFGVVHIMGMVEWDRKGDVSARGWLAGAMVPVGTGTIRTSYSRYGTDAAGNPVAKKLAVGYLHPLSKRTTLYTAAAHMNNEGTSASALNGAVTAPGQSSNGFDFGILHTF